MALFALKASHLAGGTNKSALVNAQASCSGNPHCQSMVILNT